MLMPPYAHRKSWLRSDVVAGSTTAAVVIPKAMAYATIAGLPLQTGLYVALIALVAYAFLGTSRVLSVSTTATIALLAGAQLTIAVPDADPSRLATAAAALGLLTGAMLLLAGVLRLGFLANFLSDPVLTGFKAGVGLLVIVDQLPKLFGFHLESNGFMRDLLALVQHLPESNIATMAVGVVILAILFICEQRFPRIPGPIVVTVLGIAAAAVLGLAEYGVALTGPIPSGLPAPALPDLALLQSLWPGALGIAAISFTESIAAGRAFARSEDPQPAPNRELVALGAANLASSFFSGFPAGGGTSQTAVNARAGARTQISSLVTAGVVLATLLFLSPFISLLPHVVLAAVVIVSTLPLLSPADFRSILRVRRTEFLWALAAFICVVAFGSLVGILIAIAISVLTLLYQANHPAVYTIGRKPGTDVFRPMTGEHPGDETIPGLLILRTEGRMSFASAPRVGERMWSMVEAAKPRVVILECSAIPDIEYTALRALTAAERKLRQAGISLWLASLNPEALRLVHRSALGAQLARGSLFRNLRDAVAAFEPKGSAT
jgi:SulP family sulfate permease